MSRRGTTRTGLLAAALALALTPALAHGAQNDLELVSRADGANGAPANDRSGAENTTISADGCRVAFTSDADNLTGEALNAQTNVYVRDVCAGRTFLASRAGGPSGDPGDGDSDWGGISADGRWVVFQSDATNLDPVNDGDPGRDVYLRNIDGGATLLVSRLTNGNSSGGELPSVSSDARYVSFTSEADADQLDPTAAGDPNGDRDVFIRDTAEGPATGTRLASRDSSGSAGNDASELSDVADNGTTVFQSRASDLDPADGDNELDSFVNGFGSSAADVLADPQGRRINGFSPTISANGSTVGFLSSSRATGEPFGASTGSFSVDLGSRAVQMVSRQSGVNGDPASRGGVGSVFVSGDGRFLASSAGDPSLAEGAAGAGSDPSDIFVRDRLNQTTFVTSRGPGGLGAGANERSILPSLSLDGRFLTFMTEATNLLPGVSSGVQQVYRRELNEPGFPREGGTVNLRPLAGTTILQLPGRKGKKGKRKGKKRILLAAGAAKRGKPSQPFGLGGSSQLPVGTIVDVTRGRIELTDNYNDIPQSSKFYDGKFKVEQSASGDPVLTAHLTGNTPCDKDGGQGGKKGRRGSKRSAPLSVGGPLALAAATRTRSLWGKGRGRFRTRGNRGAATVRGTEWLTIDSCRGGKKNPKATTSFTVVEGTVTIDDFGRKGAVNATLTPGGKSTYTAKP